MPVASSGARAWATIEHVIRQSLVALAATGMADYGYQRWQFMRSMRMTKEEVREESKLTDGNPEIKGRVRRVQREMVRRRMLASVPKATVVITNPTEYAVALEYHRDSMGAPKVVAKGRNLLAVRIKTIARDHGVPTVENVPLARALYASVEVGETIPPELFEAVAEVLAYLIRLKQLVL
jgi:flagellar biosynthetic protein FlhB